VRSRHFLWIWVTFKVIYLLQAFSNAYAIFRRVVQQLTRFQQWHSASCGSSGTAELLVYGRPICNTADHIYFHPVVCSFFFPRLISAVGDWMFAILPHMVWPYCEFRMQVWNVLYAARWNTGRKKVAKNSTPVHHRTTLSGYDLHSKFALRSHHVPKYGKHPISDRWA